MLQKVLSPLDIDAVMLKFVESLTKIIVRRLSVVVNKIKVRTTNDEKNTREWSLDQSSKTNKVREFQNIFSMWFLICVTGKLIVDLKRSNNSNFNELWNALASP